MLSRMTLADDILSLVTRKPVQRIEIAKQLFGRLGYQQRWGFSTGRKFAHEDCIERRGNGGPGHPFIYRRTRIVDPT